MPEKERNVRIRKQVSPATRGAIAELRVATDLLARGYHVFRSVSPASPCDLIAF